MVRARRAPITLDDLRGIVRHGSLIRLSPESRLLSPTAEGALVAPALYGEAKLSAASTEVQRWSSNTRNAYYQGRDPQGQDSVCVTLNSLAAEANALEAALVEAARAGAPIPDIAIDFTRSERTRHLGQISALTAPHRGYDALLRDSLLEGQPFTETALGRGLTEARVTSATGVLLLPHMLILGAWHSQGLKGGHGAKFGRVLVSEISGFGAMPAAAASSRIDPAAIEGVAIYQATEPPALSFANRPFLGWETEPSAKGKGKSGLYPAKRGQTPGAPALINHGNIFPVARSARASIAGAVHEMTLSLAGLRKLSFPRESDGRRDPEADLAARTALAALALVAMTGRLTAGYAVRSGCDLIPHQPPQLEWLGASLAEVTPLPITQDEAVALLREAVAALRQHDLPWGPPHPITLVPSPQLIELVEKSQGVETAASDGPDDAA
ncbi:type I-U CRISPR-associated protein Cas7 [Pseudoroseomonas globiformis]|uniref:Type I-U CRISPR-associated protein Cas7 n=1 Tax=Teichococcus globiformis TaxID=2307229 RepID=A0ABV7G3T6_9PROT